MYSSRPHATGRGIICLAGARPLIGIMWVTFGHLRPSGHIMPDHAGDRGAVFLVFAPHDHPAYQADPVEVGAGRPILRAPIDDRRGAASNAAGRMSLRLSLTRGDGLGRNAVLGQGAGGQGESWECRRERRSAVSVSPIRSLHVLRGKVQHS